MARILWVGALALATAIAQAGEPVPSADYAWPNLTDFLKQLVGKVGPPVKVYKLSMDRDGKVDLWIQDQAHPDLIDSYEYDHGKVEGPIPIKFEHYPSVAALDHHVIELTTIDFPRLPDMTAIVDPADQRLLGVFTDGDLRRAVDDDDIDLRTTPVTRLMTAHPKTITADKLAVEAAQLMEAHKIHALLVVDADHRVVGALNIHDLLRARVV